MADTSCTIPAMKKKKEPQGRSPAYMLYARINPALGKAFEELRGRNRRTIKAEIETILEKHLTEAGLWPPK